MAGMVVNTPGVRQQQQAASIEEWKRNDALRQRQQQANMDAGYDARNYGVSTSVSGPGPWGQHFQSSAPSPLDRMAGGSAGLQRVKNGGSTAGRSSMSFSQSMNQMKPAVPGPVPGRPSPISMMDRKAGEDAAYGRARDQVGSEARGSADSLSDEMSARGISGSGVEGALLGGIIQKGQGQLGDTNRAQAIDHMQRADQVQDENYQGDISLRGQDLQARGQDIEAQQSRQSNAMRLMQILSQRVI